ncbi:MAG: phosphatase PAP2 family protein [Ilumatobacteraceae bacterium]
MALQRTTRTNQHARHDAAVHAPDHVPDDAVEPDFVELWGGEPGEPADATAHVRRPLPVIATLLGLFGIIAVAVVWHHGPLAGDARLGADLLRHRGELGWRIADAVSFCASGPMVALLALATAAWLIISRRQVVEGLAVLAAPAAAGVVEVAMKVFVDRPRPFTAALTGESGNGFPSGHVSGFAALAVALLVVFVLAADTEPRGLQWAWTVTMILSIVLVMWARVAVGAHYVSDTVGGALLGGAIGLAMVPLVAWLATLVTRRVARPL